jgi:hypothetical protein
VVDLERVAEAWSALGRQLAASRRAAGLSQDQLAPLSGYSRSTVANAETGRQHVPRSFWECCDTALGTGSALARGHDKVAVVQRGSQIRSAAVTQYATTIMGSCVGSDATSPLDPGASFEPAGSTGLVQIESLRRWGWTTR